GRVSFQADLAGRAAGATPRPQISFVSQSIFRKKPALAKAGGGIRFSVRKCDNASCRLDARTEIAMPSPIDWPLALTYAAALAIGYLLGSIPFGLIVTRCAGTPDIRSIGSGNIGATNVLRTGSKALAAATLLGDILKGTAAVLATRYAVGPDGALAAAVGALLGHIFPVSL